MERPIIEINEELCNGCGKCILDCAEGALAIINGKAKLISEVYCDGLGACLNCPQGALTLKTREAAPFDEAAAMSAKLAREETGGEPLLEKIDKKPMQEILAANKSEIQLQNALQSSLRYWPIQLELMPLRADYYQNADILLAAQCAGFALQGINQDWMQGRLPIIACPKLEDKQKLIAKLADILRNNEIAKITILRMSVPCCGLEQITREAIKASGKNISCDTHVIKN